MYIKINGIRICNTMECVITCDTDECTLTTMV